MNSLLFLDGIVEWICWFIMWSKKWNYLWILFRGLGLGHKMNGYQGLHGCQMILLKLWRVGYRILWIRACYLKSLYFNKEIVTTIIITWTLLGFRDTSFWTIWTLIWIITGHIYYFNVVYLFIGFGRIIWDTMTKVVNIVLAPGVLFDQNGWIAEDTRLT